MSHLCLCFVFSSRRRHTRCSRDWSSDVCSSDLNRGILKKAKGDLDAALADFNKAIELKPDHVPSYVVRGGVKKAKGDVDGALADYNQAIELNPKYAWAYHSRGCLRYDAQGFADALVDFRKEGELDPAADYA